MVPRRKLTTAVVIGIAVLIPVVFVVFLEVYSFVIYVLSNIVDFHPSNFEVKADAYFFYSIGDELKYSNEMTPQAPTLMRGQIKNFLVSPDNKKIAVVANGLLLVVTIEEPVIRKVASVDSIFRAKPIGQQFFRDTGFQWSRDSAYLYLIKDEYHRGPKSYSDVFSPNGELWKYGVESGSLELVLKPFPASDYFLGLKSGIYYWVPTENGDLQLEYFDGVASTSGIGGPDAEIPVDKLASNFVESPFYSYDISHWM